MNLKTLLPVSVLLICLSLVLSPVTAGNPGLSSELPQNREGAHRLYLPQISRAVPHDWIGPEGGTITAIVADPQNPSNLYAGSWGGGVYRSSDGGLTWKRASTGLGNLKITALAVDPANPAIIYAGTYKGKIYKSGDRGASWRFASNGIQENAIVYEIVIDPANGRIFAATRGDSNYGDRPWAGVVYKSEDGGDSWTPSLYNLGGADYQDWAYALEIHPNAPNILFAATHEHGPVRSKDYGSTWQVLENGITNHSTRAILVDPRPDKTGTVYTGVWTRDGVFKSTNGGDRWEIKNKGLDGAQIYRMAVNPDSPNTLFAGTYNMGVMRTANGADSWSPAGLTSVGIAALYASPAPGAPFFAGTDGDGLYLSRDNGQSWNHSQAGLTATLVTSLVVSPGDPKRYYAGLSGTGVLRSLDRGRSWIPFNENLSDRAIRALVQSPIGNALFALTGSDGLFRRDLADPAAVWQRVVLDMTAESLQGTAPGRTLGGENPFFESWESFVREPDTSMKEESLQAIGASVPLLSLVFAPSDPAIAYLGTQGNGLVMSRDGGGTWSPAGWGGQTVWSIAVHPQDPDRLYATSGAAGTIGASQDGGSTWQTIQIPGLEVSYLAISPAHPGVLLAGTNDGIYRLSSGTWSQAGLPGESVTVLGVHLEQPEMIFAGTISGAWISSDAGVTWEPGPDELEGLTVQSISFSPANPGLVFYNTLGNGILRVGYER